MKYFEMQSFLFKKYFSPIQINAWLILPLTFLSINMQVRNISFLSISADYPTTKLF